jgi:nucleoid-associated protein YgaU
MKKNYSILSSCVLLLALALSLSSCSSSQTGDSEFGEDIPADAGTDAVPSEHAENTAPADGSQQDQTQASNPDQQALPADQQQAPQPQDQVASADPQTQPPVTSDSSSLTPPPAEPAPAPVAQAQPEAVAPAPVTETASTPPSTTESTSMASSSSSSSSSGETETYHVRRGDTLMRIAFEKYGDLYKWKQIYEANKDKIKDPNVIVAGTVLTLDNVSNDLPVRTGKKYMIKQGDTLARISNNVYGTPSKWKKIWQHNKPWIPNPNRIFAGFYLYYTGGKNPEDIEQHEEENPVAPVAQDMGSAPEAPREPASQVPAQAK